MIKFFCAVLAFGCASAFATTTTTSTIPLDVETKTAEFSYAIGYKLCPVKDPPPPMEYALECSGMYETLENAKVVMTKQPVANPGWTLYSGNYTGSFDFEDKHITWEILLSWSNSPTDVKYAYVDGRIKDNVNKKFTHFAVAASDNFSQLNYVTTYSTPILLDYDGHKMQLIPHFTVAKKMPMNSAPLAFRGFQRF